MKKWMNNNIITGLVCILFITVTLPMHADEPPQPPSQHGSSEDLPPGGGVPVDGGTWIVMILAIGYGISKTKKGKPIGN